MKKFYVFLSFMAALSSGHLYGQGNVFPSSGKVGIGTLSPQFPLHINSGSATTARFQNVHGFIEFGPMNAGGAHIYTDRGQFYFNKDLTLVGNPSRISAYQANPFHIRTNGLDRLTILSNGNIGIGTTNPLVKLDIRGHLLLKNADNFNSAIYLTDSNLDEERFLILLNSASASVAGRLKIGGLLVSDSYAYADPLKNDAVIKGRLAIGTPNQTSDKLSVNGTIRAKEVKLEATNWPDYVFEEGYTLMPLEEIREFIDQNGHLPGLKPANEYEAEGVNMLELNQKLLEKVEELTLYLIELEKKILSKDF